MWGAFVAARLLLSELRPLIGRPPHNDFSFPPDTLETLFSRSDLFFRVWTVNDWFAHWPSPSFRLAIGSLVLNLRLVTEMLASFFPQFSPTA